MGPGGSRNPPSNTGAAQPPVSAPRWQVTKQTRSHQGADTGPQLLLDSEDYLITTPMAVRASALQLPGKAGTLAPLWTLHLRQQWFLPVPNFIAITFKHRATATKEQKT